MSAEENAFRCLQTLQMIETWANRKTGGIDWFERFFTETVAERANLYRINASYCRMVKSLAKLPRNKRKEAIDLGIPGLNPKTWLKWTQSVKNIEELLIERYEFKDFTR